MFSLMDSEMLVNAEKGVFLFTVKVSLENGTRRGNMKKNVSCATMILYHLTLITLDIIKSKSPQESNKIKFLRQGLKTQIHSLCI